VGPDKALRKGTDTRHCLSVSRPSEPTGQGQDDQDQEDYAQSPAGVISPVRAVRPGRQYANEQQNQHDDHNGIHLVSPFLRVTAYKMDTPSDIFDLGVITIHSSAGGRDLLVTAEARVRLAQ